MTVEFLKVSVSLLKILFRIKESKAQAISDVPDRVEPALR